MKQKPKRKLYIVIIFFGLFLPIYNTAYAERATTISYLSNDITPVTAKLTLEEPVQKHYAIINNEKCVVKISFILKLTEDADNIDLSPNNMPIIYRNEHFEAILPITKDIVNYFVLDGNDNLLLEKNELIKIEINFMHLDRNDMNPKPDHQYTVYPRENEEFLISLNPENSPTFDLPKH